MAKTKAQRERQQWWERKRNWILSELDKGATREELAKDLNCSTRALRRMLGKWGRPLGKVMWNPIVAEHGEEIVKDYVEGLSLESLSLVWGVPTSTLYAFIGKRGVMRRRYKQFRPWAMSLYELHQGGWKEIEEATILTVAQEPRFLVVPLENIGCKDDEIIV